MHKKNYEAAAKMLREESETAQGDCAGEVDAAINLFVRFFAKDNVKFDEKRFREACLPQCGSMAHYFSQKTCTKPEGHEGKHN